MKKSIIIVMLLLCLPLVVSAQRLTGKVIDSATKQPLIGASLYWKNTTAGTTTSTDGTFTLKRVSGFPILVVDYLGYDIIEKELSNKDVTEITIELKPSAVDIDEVVIEGQQRGNFAKSSGIARQEQISFAGLCKMACCSLAESFENSASVTVGYSDAISGARQIKMLGLAGTYTQILDENRPIMQGAGAAYGLSYTPGMWLNSIQVSKGVASVTAGHEAITGQINLEHRKPTDDERLFLNLYFDSELRPEINLSTALPLTKDKSLSTVILLHGSMHPMAHDDNGDTFVDMPKSYQVNVANKWLWQTKNGIQLRWGWKYLQEDRLGGQHEYVKNYKKGLYDKMIADPKSMPYGSNIFNRNINAYIKLGVPVGPERTFTGDPNDAVQNNFAMILDYDNYLTDSYFGLNTIDVTEDTFRFNATYAHYFTQRSSLNVGASAYMRMMDNNYLQNGVQHNEDGGASVTPLWDFVGKSTLIEPGLFAEYTYNIEEKFSLVLGVRGDYSIMKGKYYYDTKPLPLITPRSHIKWSITPRTTLRASAGMGFRRQNLITDNIWMMTTSRTIVDNVKDDMEKALTVGGSISQSFRLAGDDQATISFDYFRTQFFNTMVFDQETADNTTLIYNSKGRSFTDNYQIDFNWTPFKGFDLFMTFRYTNAKMTLERDNGERILVERPLTSRFKGLINIQYAVRRWIFDVTAQLNGPMRLPELDGDLSNVQKNPTLSPIYPMFFAQISYKISNFTIYAGCENIANFKQQKPIVVPEGGPYAPGFNSSMVWGPLTGVKGYVGIRLNIY